MSLDERVERYELLGELATGGMATVYVGRQRGPFGFSRTVAIKSMHPQFAKDDGFRTMFLDEATLSAKIRHPNVIQTLDIVSAATRLLLVMEYVDGAALASLLRAAIERKLSIPPAVAVAILSDALHGLHAAHELVDEQGEPLAVIHRDVSPQNILVGADGLARILDFGVAKAASQRYVTRTNEVKGKIAYMSPEQLCGEELDRRTDIHAAGVVLWETLTSRRLFEGTNDGEIVKKLLEGKLTPPSLLSEHALPAALDRVVMKALAKRPDERWATAEQMARELDEAVPPAPRGEVTALVKELAGEELATRAERLRARSPASLEPDAKMLADLLTARATLSTNPTSERHTARGRPVLTTAAMLAAVTALTGGAFVVGSRYASAPVEQAQAQRERASSASAAPSPSESTMARSVPETSTTGNEPAPALTPAGRSSSATAGAPVRPRPPHKSTPTPTPVRARSGVDCRVAYTVDAYGDRHYKPECVE